MRRVKRVGRRRYLANVARNLHGLGLARIDPRLCELRECRAQVDGSHRQREEKSGYFKRNCLSG